MSTPRCKDAETNKDKAINLYYTAKPALHKSPALPTRIVKRNEKCNTRQKKNNCHTTIMAFLLLILGGGVGERARHCM